MKTDPASQNLDWDYLPANSHLSKGELLGRLETKLILLRYLTHGLSVNFH